MVLAAATTAAAPTAAATVVCVALSLRRQFQEGGRGFALCAPRMYAVAEQGTITCCAGIAVPSETGPVHSAVVHSIYSSVFCL